MISEITVRTADAADLPVVVALQREASAWLHSKGLDQWQRPPPVDRIRQRIDSGEVFLAEDHTGRPVATVTLSDSADPDFWTPADDPGSALYVHRLVVTRRLAGRAWAALCSTGQPSEPTGRATAGYASTPGAPTKAC